MSGRQRLTARRLEKIERRLSARDKELVLALGNLGLMSGEQLWQVYFHSASKDNGRRAALKVLSRLDHDDVLTRLERRVGGARRGSTGFVYALGPAGQRLVRRWNSQPQKRVRQLHEPGEAFTRHRLGVSQVFTGLKVAERAGELRLSEFVGEPDCWRQRIGSLGQPVTLKPDAYVLVTTGDRELHWFVEIDMATESLPVIRRKADAYLAHYRSGAEQQVMPRVAWLVPTPARVDALTRVLTSHAGSPEGLHVVTLAQNANNALKGETI